MPQGRRREEINRRRNRLDVGLDEFCYAYDSGCGMPEGQVEADRDNAEGALR